MLESSVEEYLRLAVIAEGARCDKVVNLTRIGAPDREIQWPGRSLSAGFWVGGIDKAELKKPKGETRGGKCSSAQGRYHQFLALCGIPVYLIDTKEKVDAYILARRNGLHLRALWSVPVPNL